MTVDVAGDQVDSGAVALDDRAVGGLQVLVAGRSSSARRAGSPTAQDVRALVAEGELTVDDSAARGHPLDVARVAEIVTVLEDAIEDECDRLQASVRVPRTRV